MDCHGNPLNWEDCIQHIHDLDCLCERAWKPDYYPYRFQGVFAKHQDNVDEGV